MYHTYEIVCRDTITHPTVSHTVTGVQDQKYDLAAQNRRLEAAVRAETAAKANAKAELARVEDDLVTPTVVYTHEDPNPNPNPNPNPSW